MAVWLLSLNIKRSLCFQTEWCAVFVDICCDLCHIMSLVLLKAPRPDWESAEKRFRGFVATERRGGGAASDTIVLLL